MQNINKLDIKKRNEYIDVLKGIAALNIIIIHTTFWAGQSYIPEWFQNMTLFIDVPFFFYLSGWGMSYTTCNYVRTCKSIVRIWFKWIFFISILTCFCHFSKLLPVSFQGIENIRELINNYMFNARIPSFPVVGGSIWFMQYYIVVVLLNSFLITIFETKLNSEILKKQYVVFLVGAFLWISYGRYSFGLDLTYYIFYSFFWMLGLLRWGGILNNQKFFASIVIIIFGYVFTSYLQNIPLYDLQTAKFPPTLKYGLASMFVIIFSKKLEFGIKKNNKFISHIGRNAIYYYFAQGIGSSINYFFVEKIDLKLWAIKWGVTLVINILITIIIAEVLSFLYFCFEKIIWKIKRKCGL